MGYTHYWSIDPATPQDAYDAALADVRRIIGDPRVNPMLAGWDGTGEPDGEGDIRFNGRAPDEDCETFFLPAFAQDAGWNFCKTQRNPYDKVVTACLLALHQRLPHHSCLDTDGAPEDWLEGATLDAIILGRTIPVPTRDEFYSAVDVQPQRNPLRHSLQPDEVL